MSDEELIFSHVKHSPLKIVLRSWINSVGALGMTVLTAGRARYRAPFEVHYTSVPMPLNNLDLAFEGFRLVQLTDIHLGEKIPPAYLDRIVDRVNELGADLVAVTGDLVSHDGRYVGPVADCLARLRAPVIATFGNHDYNNTPHAWLSTEVADALQQKLEARGATVLRNQ